MRLSDVMTQTVKTVHPGEPIASAAERMRLNGFHHLVVAIDDAIVGVVSEHDLRSKGRHDACVGDVMSPDVISAPSDTTVRKAANLLRGRSFGCLPVVDAGQLVGIVTVTDLLELLGRGDVRP